MRGDQLHVHFRGGQVKLASTGRWHVIIEFQGKKVISEQEFFSREAAQQEYHEHVRPKVMRAFQESNFDLGQQLGGYVELKHERITDEGSDDN